MTRSVSPLLILALIAPMTCGYSLDNLTAINWSPQNWTLPKTNWTLPKKNWTLPKTNWTLPKTNWSIPQVNWTMPSMRSANWTDTVKSPFTGEKTGFEITENPTCSGLFSLPNFQYQCTNNCDFGSNMTITGNMYSDTGFWRRQNLTLSVCTFSSNVGCYKVYQAGVDLCAVLTPLDGQSCPHAGNYTYKLTFNLPAKSNTNWLWAWTVTVDALFAAKSNGYDMSTKCSFGVKTIHTTTTAQNQMLWSLTGLAVLASAAVFGLRRRRLMLVSQKDSQHEIKFERMSGPVHNGALV